MATRAAVTFDTRRILEDMTDLGWNARALARATRLSPATVSRFLAGRSQTAANAKKIADALGRPMRRYRVPREEQAHGIANESL